MSDYLGNVAATSLKQTPSVQPRLAARFETLHPARGLAAAGQFAPQAMETPATLDETGFSSEGTQLQPAKVAVVRATPVMPSFKSLLATSPPAELQPATSSVAHAESPVSRAEPISPVAKGQAQRQNQRAEQQSKRILTRAQPASPEMDISLSKTESASDSPEPAHPVPPVVSQKPAAPPRFSDEISSLLPRTVVRREKPATRAQELGVKPAFQHPGPERNVMNDSPAVDTPQAPLMEPMEKRTPPGVSPVEPSTKPEPLPQPPATSVLTTHTQPPPEAAPPATIAVSELVRERIRPHLIEPVGNAPATPAPTIRVTIGRVEVRANTPPAPQSRARPARRQPALSLDAYLKQRNRGHGGRR